MRFLPLCAFILLLSAPLLANDNIRYHARHSAMQTITAEQLRGHVGVLADDALEGREAGTRGGYAAAGYLADLYKKYGLKGAGDQGSYFQSFGNGYRNILGLWEGSDPQLRHEIIVIAAHYDHVGYGSPRNSYGPIGYIHNGADDNASGTAGVLETIEAISKLRQRPRRSILFVLFDGEEKGLLGSKHWVSNPTLDLNRVRLMINCDMIGRLRNNTLKVFGTRTSQHLRRLVSQNNAVGLNIDFDWELKRNSDHYPFYSNQIPVLMLHTGLHDDYHRPRDDVDKVNVEGMQLVSQLLFNITYDTAHRDVINGFRPAALNEKPADRELLERAMPPRPSRLGISWTEAAPGEVVVSRVDYDSPADRAGVLYNDRIVAVNGQPLRDGRKLLSAIQAAESQLTLKVRRDGQPQLINLPVTLDGKRVRLGISWREDPAEPGTLVVGRVVPGTPAQRLGVQVGDRVYELNGQTFADGLDFMTQVQDAAGPTELVVERAGRIRRLQFHLAP